MIKSYTDIKQSKKLAEILPLESADGGWYRTNNPLAANNKYWLYTKYTEKSALPAWSLVALLDVLPEGTRLLKSTNISSVGDIKYHCDCPKLNIDKWFDNPVNACADMIVHLHELNLL